MAHQNVLLDVLKATRENLVPCPHGDCISTSHQFYSAHGLEQHWRRFHRTKTSKDRANFSQDKVSMGENLLKKIHFELIKKVLNEKFVNWKRVEVPGDIANIQKEFKASYGGTTLQLVASNTVDAVKQFGLLLCAGGFVPRFSKHSTGIDVEVSCATMSAVLKMWHEDVKKNDGKFTKIIVKASFVETKSHSSQQTEFDETEHNEGLSVPELELTGDKLVDTLRTIFKIQSFRPYQREVIESLQAGRHTLGILPTGSGKTLCFTLPAVMSEKLSFAIFPLNSLMLDMYHHFSKLGVTCCMVNQYTEKETLNRLFHDFHQHKPQTKIILITPESIQRKDFQDILPILASSNKLGFVVIDEIHCMAESSPDYREDYKKLNFLTKLSVPIIGLTATATNQTVKIISETLGLENNIVVFKAPAQRPNLVTKVFCRKKKEKIFEEVEKLICDQFLNDCGIIYCLHQSDVMEISYRLSNRPEQIPVSIYYGEGLDQESRTVALHGWLTGRAKILIATKAAGTGIDKPDVRFVIQIGAPNSIEEYYQQIGRAGRDRLESTCITFYRAENFTFHLKHLTKNSDDTFRGNGVQRIHQTQQYLAHLKCRKQFISNYFGDPLDVQKDCNQCCDNCIQGVRYRDIAANDDLRKLVVCLQAVNGKIKEPSVQLLIKTFVGSKCKIVKDAKLDEINEHGLGTGLTASHVEDLLQVAFNEDLLEEKVPFNPTGKGKISFIIPGKNALDIIRGCFLKQLTVSRK